MQLQRQRQQQWRCSRRLSSSSASLRMLRISTCSRLKARLALQLCEHGRHSHVRLGCVHSSHNPCYGVKCRQNRLTQPMETIGMDFCCCCDSHDVCRCMPGTLFNLHLSSSTVPAGLMLVASFVYTRPNLCMRAACIPMSTVALDQPC